jgi:hypothetical protein
MNSVQRSTSRRSVWRSALGLLLATLLVSTAVACGVPTGDETFTAIPPADVPLGLAETTTTTTVAPTTTLAETPDTTTPESTTTPIRLDPVEIYFLTRGRLQPVVRELPPGFSADQVADILEEGPPPDLALDTLVADGLVAGSFESRGVLTVDLDAETFGGIPTTRQTEAIAQIVLTMISSLRRVGLVNFTIDGEAISVKKGNSLLSEVGEPLSYEDYVMLLASPPPLTEEPETPDTFETDDTGDTGDTDDTETSETRATPATRAARATRISSRAARPGRDGAASPCRP